jgi:hypothetical protein
MPKEPDAMTTATQQKIMELMRGLAPTDRKTAIVNAADTLTDKDSQDVAGKIGMPPPDERTRNLLWKITVCAFAIVLVGTFLFIASAMFITQSKDIVTLVKPELVLSMFTSAVGFLAGLFVPSPAAKKQG